MHSYLHKNFILAKSGCYTRTSGKRAKVGLHAQGNDVYEGPKGTTHWVINALTSSPRGIPGGLFIVVVRGSGNNV
jgi:hypothetical protein